MGVTFKTKIAEHDKTIAANKTTIETLKKEKENEVSQMKKLNSENDIKVKEQEKKIQSLNESVKTIENLEKEKGMIEAKMKKEESVQRGLREIIAKHEATIGKKEEEATSLQKRNQEVIGDKNKRIAELNNDLTKLKESQAEWENKVKNLLTAKAAPNRLWQKKM